MSGAGVWKALHVFMSWYLRRLFTEYFSSHVGTMVMKRNLEFESVRDGSCADSTTVHGVVASVSPMKKGKHANYFKAKLTDGQKHMRVGHGHTSRATEEGG